MLWSLQVRSRSILRRERSLVKAVHQYKDLIQHFNPACRVARLMPTLPSARLLFSLTDYDLPAAHALRKPSRRSLLHLHEWLPMLSHRTGSPLVSDFCSAFIANVQKLLTRIKNAVIFCCLSILRQCVHALLLLPLPCQLFFVESFCSLTTNGLLLGIFFGLEHQRRNYLAIILAFVCFSGIGTAFLKIFESVRREKHMLSNLSRLQDFYDGKKVQDLPTQGSRQEYRWNLEGRFGSPMQEMETEESDKNSKYAATQKKKLLKMREKELAKRRSKQFP